VQRGTGVGVCVCVTVDINVGLLERLNEMSVWGLAFVGTKSHSFCFFVFIMA